MRESEFSESCVIGAGLERQNGNLPLPPLFPLFLCRSLILSLSISRRQRSGCRVSGVEFRVESEWFRVLGFGRKVLG